MIDQLWTEILRFIETLVSPNWGALVALIPLVLVGLIGLYLVWLVVRYKRAGPARRVPRRRAVRPPPGVHLPGPSYAPIIAGVGLFLLFAGLVFGGVVLGIGLAFLILALLYWGREAMRDYDHALQPERGKVPAVIHTPPPGVHVPGPTFRPILIAIALMVLFYGLVFGGPLLVVGILTLAIALIGWLNDARREYRDVLVADRTGHLPPATRPGYPRGIIAAFLVLLIGGLVLQTGLLPPRSAVGGTPGASAAPSGAPGSPGPGPGGSPGPGGPGPADVTITAEKLAFTPTTVTAPVGRPFKLRFVNNDASIPHNVAIHSDGPTGPEVYRGDVFSGVGERTYEVPALQPGAYAFICTVHPNMTGTLTAQ